ncbi:MAG: hypothetical protein AAF617_07855 [Bacteroidota bacterium]
MTNKDVSFIALNDMVYVFDTGDLAKQFDLQEIPRLLGKEPALDVTAASKDDRILGQVRVKAKIELFKDKDFDGRYGYSVIYIDQVVTKRRTWWGWDYYENNKYEQNIVSFFRNITSSYRVTLTDGGRLDTSGASTSTGYAKMKFKLRANLLDDGGPTWKRDVSKNPYFPGNNVDEDSDLSNNRMWGALGLTTWNDEIESLEIEIVSG